ncbi:MAG: DUF2723 domain-containing protein [Deltaproteobacteria bacterium]|nr:DUF2723 domain-containing protein [Deltaproteobacteria bacterium]
MSLVFKRRRSSKIRRLFMALAISIPFLCYLATASAYGYWLDSREFIAASIGLGIAHPPGQPLTALVGRIFAMLPIGPLSLRIALASAAMASIASLALFCAIETTLRSMAVERRWVVLPMALGVSLFVTGSYGWWFQAVRPEVYALQAALTCVILERLVALEAAWPTKDFRPLVTSAFVLGLALANHHLLAILLLPVIAPTLIRAMRSRIWRAYTLAVVALLLGLSVYLYLPLRAAAHPMPNLGEPVSIERFFWVVSAQAFQKNTGSGVPLSLSERHLDVLALLFEDLHIYCIIALPGLYAMLRTSGVRRLGLIWMVVLCLSVVIRAYLGFVRSNPDAQGYLLPAYAAIGALFAAFFAALVKPQKGVDHAPGRGAVAIAAVVVLLGLAQIYNHASKADLSGFTAIDDVDDLIRREAPAKSVILLHAPQTIFVAWGGEAEDCLRPDVTIVPVPFLTYPGMVDNLIAREPELRDLLRGYLLNGEFLQPELESLAAKRPLFVEMDVRVAPSLYQSMVPSGLNYEVIAGGATDADERIAAAAQNEIYKELYERIRTQRFEQNTKNFLLWRHFTDSLYYMGFGDRKSAKKALYLAKTLQATAKPLSEMEELLGNSDEKGPIDVTRFLKLMEK